jgi:catechol 2,3-dioxygenase-like lactoylglutathione lyase family enzyme
VCLWSKDFDADVKFLQDKGVEFLGEPSNQLTKAGLSQVCAFYDPDGTVIEMTNDWARPKEAGSKAKGMFDGGETL